MAPSSKGATNAYPEISQDDAGVRIVGTAYTWQWTAADDEVTIRDAKGRTIAAGSLQPAVVVKPAVGVERCQAGRVSGYQMEANRLTIRYGGVNGQARLALSLRFDDEAIWLEPIVYETDAAEDIVGVHYFAAATADGPQPTLFSSHQFVPGVDMSCGISPIIDADVRLTATPTLGAAALHGPAWGQQWGLPVHYFCGLTFNGRRGAAASMTTTKSDAFCCGLASLPVGDFWLDLDCGRVSPRINIRGDLWGHRRGPGTFTLGSDFLFTFGGTYRQAIANYYQTLVRAGIVTPGAAGDSARKTEIALTPQFNTWGAQVARGLAPDEFNEEILTAIYDEFRVSGMRAGMFVIDDKWEGIYGGLEHDPARFPQFEATLQRIRADGYRLGLWAALLRCQDPAALGLSTDHMLRQPDGTPLHLGRPTSRYYIFDVTQPEVAAVLPEIARRFIRRYQPDLVKFDFGYELPVLSAGAPKDLEWSGERLLHKGLDVIIGAMKAENPDLVVMYYGLSPLLLDYYDLHSPDDLYLCSGDYDLEANRRFFFSSLCGDLGMPTYGSSGYDWASAPSIWFDSAAVGTVGSLNSFTGDETGAGPRPEWIAKYNGICQALRSTATFTVEPLAASELGAASGATSSSWVRYEQGGVVLVALRPWRFDRQPVAGHYRDLVASDTAVIVASRDEHGLATARELAIVPFGTGNVTIHRSPDSTSSTVTEHYFGGDSQQQQIAVTDGAVRLSLREQSEDGQIVEWIRVAFAD